MGAAGYVTVYDESTVRERFKELFPDNDIDTDWWYLKTCSANVGGNRLIFDYGDDQGGHEGTNETFWFAHDEDEDYFAESSRAQRRVQTALHAAGALAQVEVWT